MRITVFTRVFGKGKNSGFYFVQKCRHDMFKFTMRCHLEMSLS